MTEPSFAHITDPLIRQGLEAAVQQTLLPAITEEVYPGHFNVTADGGTFGAENTWPGLDGWEIAGALLLLGYERLVLDYFDFVQAAQRPDGDIPFAIFPAETPPPGMDAHLRGLRYPQDVYIYQPPPREGRPAWANLKPRRWIGLFAHWQPKANPLTTLGPVSHILTAAELWETLRDRDWLRVKLPSLAAAGRSLLARRSANGLISGAGFYLEDPPRNQWDGITQCYTIYVWRLLAGWHRLFGEETSAAFWQDQATALAARFQALFWRGDHWAEYVHPEHGVVDAHGLSDVNWAAIALDVATEEQARQVWPLLLNEPAFWHGDMPTQVVSKPYNYQEWEFREPLPFVHRHGPLYDIAAMGRVWFLEALACHKMGADERLRASARLVCRMGLRHDGFWHERYHPLQVWDVYPAGPKGYCEYPAILVRVVLGNQELFSRA